MSFERLASLTHSNNGRLSPNDWAFTAGLLCASLAGFFLLVLVSGTVLGLSVPEKNRFLLVWTVAFGAGFASLFFGGVAASKGQIPLPFITEHPIQFAVLAGLIVLTLASMAGTYFLIHGRNVSPISIRCPESYRPYQAQMLGFAFCHPAKNWTLNVSDFGTEGRGVLLSSAKDPHVKVHFRVAAIPEAFAGAPRNYIESIVAMWRKLDRQITLNSVYFAGKEAFFFEANIKDAGGRHQQMHALHILLSGTRILFVNSSHFDNTPQETRDVLIRTVSTIAFAR